MRKPIGLALALALACWSAVGQADSPPNRPALAQAANDDDCLTNCRAVLDECKSICRDSKARDRGAEYGAADRKPVDECIKDCEEDYTFCQQSC